MKATFLGAMALAVFTGACAQADASDADDAAEQAMLDRVAIEDMVVRYYANLGGSDATAFGDFYTDDAVFDVNGIVGRGKEEIEAIYGDVGEDGPGQEGTFHMLLSNPVIEVDGDTATASFLWTGILNGDLQGPPTLVEQGREYDRLVKQGGKWLIEKRVVIADSGLPDRYMAGYQPRKDYDIAADTE